MPKMSAHAASASKPANAQKADTSTIGSGVSTSGPTGAQRFLGFLSPYRIDVQQGNFISREMVAQLKEGMRTKDGVTPEQVRFVLGTPLLTDIFHSNRWDYVFRLKKGSGELQRGAKIDAHETVEGIGRERLRGVGFIQGSIVDQQAQGPDLGTRTFHDERCFLR